MRVGKGQVKGWGGGRVGKEWRGWGTGNGRCGFQEEFQESLQLRHEKNVPLGLQNSGGGRMKLLNLHNPKVLRTPLAVVKISFEA